MVGSSPTVRMRQLGMELRRLRVTAGKSQQQAADWLAVTESAISRMETGARRATVPNIRNLGQLYNVDPTHTAFLERLAREARERGWWADFGDTVPDWFRDLLGMETVADEAWFFASLYFPGLLQCQDYIDAVVSRPDARRLRAARQKRLTDTDPLAVRVVLDEAVIHRRVGGPDIMRRQIRHVITMAHLPNVTIQLLPLSAGFISSVTGPFTALRFPEEPMNTVYVELTGSAIYLEKPAAVERYTTNFERLAGLAFDEKETIAFLEKAEERWHCEAE